MVRNMRAIKRAKRSKILTKLLFLLNVLIWGSAIYLWSQAADLAPQTYSALSTLQDIQPSNQGPTTTFNNLAARTLDDINIQINSASAVLVNLTSGEILFEHRKNESVYPASVTKIMTILIGLEYAPTEEVIIQADFNALAANASSMAGFIEGEVRTLSEVLHGSFLSSGADATTSLAYHVAGSYQGFVDLMNITAQRLGMSGTNFVNASGLHHENHFTTAYDTALLLNYALANPRFREIFEIPAYSFINASGYEQIMQSNMFRNLPNRFFNGGEILGGKTGYTTPAGLCLASTATDGVSEFALVTFNASTTDEAVLPNIQDALTLYEYFFASEEEY